MRPPAWDEHLERYEREEDAPHKAIGELGLGGTGIVHKVINTRRRDNRVYARKTLQNRDNSNLTASDLIQVKLELQAILKLQHNNHIVKAVTPRDRVDGE